MAEPKRIAISNHARERMNLRGATVDEAIETIRSETWMPAKRGKQQAKCRFEFEKPVSFGGKEYKFKEIAAIFVDEMNEIVVVTVKVYYTNKEEAE